jgi:hypothetical protein
LKRFHQLRKISSSVVSNIKNIVNKAATMMIGDAVVLTSVQWLTILIEHRNSKLKLCEMILVYFQVLIGKNMSWEE